MNAVKQKTYENLRYRIITQKLAPGQLLKDKELMAAYGIGRTPLREVILKLQSEGLINRVPRAGTWVAPMDFSFLKQITEIRIGLEGIAGELAVRRITPEQLAELEQIIGEAEALEQKDIPNIEALLHLESRFHQGIFTAAHNPKLEELLRTYQSLGARYWHHIAFNHNELSKQISSQRDILSAIQKKDEQTTRQLMEDHIKEYMGRIEEHIKILENVQNEKGVSPGASGLI